MMELYNVRENRTIKCEKKVTWYSRLPTSGHRTPLFLGYRRITHYKKENIFDG